MAKKHTITAEEFDNDSYYTELATNGKKWLNIRTKVVNGIPESQFVVVGYQKNIDAKFFSTLSEAVEYYNSL